MSNRDPDIRYETLAQALRFDWIQNAKLLLHTVTPGLVRAYDPETKRARVQPAIRRLMVEDGEESTLDRPPILDVPLRQPATGTHLQHHQIDEGDVVLLCFSERGIEKFKAQWGELSDPPRESCFAERDALAIPWGVETITPVRSTGWIVQNESGSCYLSLDQTIIRGITGASSVIVRPSNIELDTGSSNILMESSTTTLTVGGSSITITDGQITIRSAQVTIQADRIDDEAM